MNFSADLFYLQELHHINPRYWKDVRYHWPKTFTSGLSDTIKDVWLHLIKADFESAECLTPFYFNLMCEHLEFSAECNPFRSGERFNADSIMKEWCFLITVHTTKVDCTVVSRKSMKLFTTTGTDLCFAAVHWLAGDRPDCSSMDLQALQHQVVLVCSLANLPNLQASLADQTWLACSQSYTWQQR